MLLNVRNKIPKSSLNYGIFNLRKQVVWRKELLGLIIQAVPWWLCSRVAFLLFCRSLQLKDAWFQTLHAKCFFWVFSLSLSLSIGNNMCPRRPRQTSIQAPPTSIGSHDYSKNYSLAKENDCNSLIKTRIVLAEKKDWLLSGQTVSEIIILT